MTFTNDVYTSRIKCSMRVNIKIFYLKEVEPLSHHTHQKLFWHHIYNRFKFRTYQNFHAFFEKFSHLKLKPAPTQDHFLDFLQNEFSHSKCFQKAFLHLNGGACSSGHAQAQSTYPQLSVKIHVVKSQGNYLESGLDSVLNGWTFQKMHEILLCFKFEAVVDVIWKSFWVCLITWMLTFFQIKYFDVDTHGAYDSASVYLISECHERHPNRCCEGW